MGVPAKKRKITLVACLSAALLLIALCLLFRVPTRLCAARINGTCGFPRELLGKNGFDGTGWLSADGFGRYVKNGVRITLRTDDSRETVLYFSVSVGSWNVFGVQY